LLTGPTRQLEEIARHGEATRETAWRFLTLGEQQRSVAVSVPGIRSRKRYRDSMTKRHRFIVSLPGLVILAILGLVIWSSDRITLQGERTIYTVNCERGVWQGTRCTGKLAPGERYAFRASPRRHEVLYWIRNSRAPSGKFSDCTVRDRDNWTCNLEMGEEPAVAYEMVKGRPTRGVAGD